MSDIEVYDLEYLAKVRDGIDELLDQITQQLMKGNTISAGMTARKIMSEAVHLQRVIHEATFEV